MADRGNSTIIVLGAVSLIYAVVLSLNLPRPAAPVDRDELRAAEIMDRAIGAVRGRREKLGRPIDAVADINRTGLIGLESSPITTSHGQLEAKRTTTNPNVAGVIAKLLKQAGVGPGDAVAVGASGSFPGLIVAALSAVEALEARPLMILSLGASNWGANDPEFTCLDMLDGIRAAGVFDVRPIALAVGGENDDGSDMSAEGRDFLVRKIHATGLPFLRLPDLAENVRERLRSYDRAAAPGAVKMFINVGGSWANMGVDSSILNLKPGLTEVAAIPPEGKRGVIQAMAERGIPVSHLLFVKGLAERYGLPWDPVPLPKPGEGELFIIRGRAPLAFLAAALAYFVVIAAGLIFIGRNRSLSIFG